MYFSFVFSPHWQVSGHIIPMKMLGACCQMKTEFTSPFPSLSVLSFPADLTSVIPPLAPRVPCVLCFPGCSASTSLSPPHLSPSWVFPPQHLLRMNCFPKVPFPSHTSHFTSTLFLIPSTPSMGLTLKLVPPVQPLL